MYQIESNYEVVIVGGGVAGLSAALLLARSRVNLCLINDSKGSLYQGETHNFLTNDGETKRTIEQKGRLEVSKYPNVTIVEGKVTTVEKDALEYSLRLANGSELTTKYIVFSPGLRYPYGSTGIEGFDSRFGLDIFTCPYCHGYELIGKKVVVIGTSEKDVDFIRLLSNWFEDLCYITHNGAKINQPLTDNLDTANINVIDGVVEKITGEVGTPTISLKNDIEKQADVIYLADLSETASWSIIDGLGIERGIHPLTGKVIYKTDAVGRTDLGSVFIIDDSRTGFSTLTGAAHEGMIAGYMVTNDIIENRTKSVSPELAY